MISSKEWDVFICHASEDKGDVALPLSEELKKRGLKVWIDKGELTIGDGLSRKIDEGLSKSKYGVVILSHSFFQKDWPQKELDGLFSKEIGGRKVVLPVWHKLRSKDVVSYSPLLASKLAGTTERGVLSLADELILAMGKEMPKEESINFSKKDDVEVKVDYKRILIGQYLHKYSLSLSIVLNAPPSKNGFRLKILWPEFIRISKLLNLEQIAKQRINYIDYDEYLFENSSILFPGDKLEVLAPNSRAEIEYEFNTRTWQLVDENRILLFWKIYFHDQMPIEGQVDFKNLNLF